MKRHSWISIIVALTIIIFFLSLTLISAEDKSTSTTPIKKKLVVADFTAIGPGIDKELGKAVAELLRSCFVDTGKFIVVDKTTLDKTILEKKITATEQTGIELGKLLNTDFVVDGSILKIGSSYIMTGKIADVKSGEVLRGKNISGKSDDQLPDMARQLVSQLIDSQVPYSATTTVSIISTVSVITTITEYNK
jgi:TolB-like protein